MLTLILIYGVVAVGLGVVLTVGTLWFQGAVYTEPVEGIAWRVVTSAAVLMIVLGLWGLLDYREPGDYAPIFMASLSDEKEFPELRAINKKDGRNVEVRYEMKKTAQGRPEYRSADGRPFPSRPEAIIVREDDQDVRFEPERDANQNFKTREGQSLHYVDSRGREMTADKMGHLSTFRTGLFLVNVGINLLLLLAWFGSLWLLLRFQWGHALGLALVAWLVVVLGVQPYLLNRVEAVAKEQAPAASAASITRCA